MLLPWQLIGDSLEFIKYSQDNLITIVLFSHNIRVPLKHNFFGAAMVFRGGGVKGRRPSCDCGWLAGYTGGYSLVMC